MMERHLQFKRSDSRYGVSNSILLLAIANIRRNRVRSSLLVTTIALATLLFLTALGSLSGLQKPIENMMLEQNASHAILDFDARIYSADELLTWWQNQDEVVSVTSMLPFMITSSRPLHKGKEMGSYLMMTERPSSNLGQDQLVFIEGKETNAPLPGELWLPSATAFSARIGIEDRLEIPTEQGIRSFKVSAIVVDPQYSSGFIGPARAWVAPGELVATFPFGQLTSYMFGVRLSDPALLPLVWSRFNESLGGGFTGGYLSFDKITNSYTQTTQLMAVLVMIFAFMALIVSIFIISTTISAEILSSYRTFGILKSLGFTSRNVVFVFQIQFLILSLLALPIGILCAYFSTDVMISLMLKSIGASSEHIGFLWPSIVTCITVITTILGVVALSGSKAGKIKPASAIRYGAPEKQLVRRVSFHLRLATKLPIEIVIALKNLSSGNKREFFDLIAISITAFVLFFSVNIYNSMSVMDENLPFWGLDNSDIRIGRDTSGLFGMSYDSLKRELTAHSDVQTVVGHINQSAVVPKSEHGGLLDVDGYVVDGSLDAIGYQNVKGRNPQTSTEISLGIPLAKQYDVRLGDNFSLNVNGQTLELTVVGIFQGTNNGGFFYRLPFSALQKVDPNLEPRTLLVKLYQREKRVEFMEQLEKKLGQAVSTELSEKLVESQLEQIVAGLAVVLSFVSGVLVLVAGVSIYNSTAMGIYESKRHLGVFRAVGFTVAQIRHTILAKSAILGCVALIIGMVIFTLSASKIMDAMMANFGMTDFPMQISFVGSILVVPGIVLICLISALIPSHQVGKIAPRTLIVE